MWANLLTVTPLNTSALAEKVASCKDQKKLFVSQLRPSLRFGWLISSLSPPITVEDCFMKAVRNNLGKLIVHSSGMDLAKQISCSELREWKNKEAAGETEKGSLIPAAA
jgi:hypothetical protein